MSAGDAGVPGGEGGASVAETFRDRNAFRAGKRRGVVAPASSPHGGRTGPRPYKDTPDTAGGLWGPRRAGRPIDP